MSYENEKNDFEDKSSGKYEHIVERVCPICQKTFIVQPFHVYRNKADRHHNQLVCSWSCVLASEKMRDEKIRERRMEKPTCRFCKYYERRYCNLRETAHDPWNTCTKFEYNEGAKTE